MSSHYWYFKIRTTRLRVNLDEIIREYCNHYYYQQVKITRIDFWIGNIAFEKEMTLIQVMNLLKCPATSLKMTNKDTFYELEFSENSTCQQDLPKRQLYAWQRDVLALSKIPDEMCIDFIQNQQNAGKATLLSILSNEERVGVLPSDNGQIAMQACYDMPPKEAYFIDIHPFSNCNVFDAINQIKKGFVYSTRKYKIRTMKRPRIFVFGAFFPTPEVCERNDWHHWLINDELELEKCN